MSYARAARTPPDLVSPSGQLCPPQRSREASAIGSANEVSVSAYEDVFLHGNIGAPVFTVEATPHGWPNANSYDPKKGHV